MSLAQLPFSELLNAFRAPEPTPGGGSASALAGAVGASLLAMVAALEKTRAANVDDDLRRLRGAGQRCASLSDRLSGLMDEDARAYDNVVAAFKLPKSSDAEKSARAIRIQEALRGATEVPLEVMRACADALEQGAVVRELGNPNARSDVQVGLDLLRTAVRGARLNVEINLESLKDAAYVSAVRAEADALSVRAAP